MDLLRALMGIFAVMLFVALPRQATALDECDFGFKVNTESSALQALTSDANTKGGFWLSINDAPPDIQKIAKYVGLLQTCVMTPDGKPRSVSIGGTTRTIKSPQVFKCTASLFSDNRLITNHHCFYDPTFTEAGFNIVTEARVTFGYRFADDTSGTKTYRVLNRAISKSQELDALLLQIIGGDANTDLGGHFPMDTKGDLQPLQELKMIHHPAGQPQQYSSGTCKVHRLQSQLGEQATSLRHTCETTGGSSGSLILDARSLAIVGLHNLGGLNRQSDSFNAGHRIGPINAAFGLGMKEMKPSNDSENLALNITKADPCDPQFALAKQVNQCAVWDGYLASCSTHSKASEARRLQASACKVDACDGQFEKAKASNSCDGWKSYAQACGNHDGMLVAEMAVELTCKPVAEEKPAEKSKQVTSTSKPSEATIAGWLKSADAASSRKDYEQAFELFRKAADAGDQCGQYRLGHMYEFGLGLASSRDRAEYWYQKAVAQNGKCSWVAKYALDLLAKPAVAPKPSTSKPSAATIEGWVRTANDYYGQKKFTEAVKWYRKAADQGYARAQYNLGYMYLEGLGVTQSDTEAVKWFRKAAEQGYASAQSMLAFIYEVGRGVPRSVTEAVEWLRKAAARGEVTAQCRLALLTAHGRGTAKDPNSAADWTIKSLQNGYDGCITRMTENATVREIQKILKFRGLYTGAIDGSNGPNTQAAMRKLLPN